MSLKYKVTVPNKMFNGIREGVAFVNGEAEVELPIEKVTLFKYYGYTVEEIVEEKPKKAEPKKAEAKK
jgi:hypothetical protein